MPGGLAMQVKMLKQTVYIQNTAIKAVIQERDNTITDALASSARTGVCKHEVRIIDLNFPPDENIFAVP